MKKISLKNLDYLSILKYISLFIIFILFFAVEPIPKPYAAAPFTAFLYLGYSPVVLPILFAAAAFLAGGAEFLLVMSVPAAFMLMVFSIYKLLKKKPRAEMFFYVLACFIAYIFIGSSEEIADRAIASLISTALCFLSIPAFSLIVNKGLKYKPSYEELASLAVVVVCVFLGMLHTIGLNPTKAFALLILLSATYLFRTGISTMISAIIALPFAIYLEDLGFIGVIIIWSLSSSAFMPLSRYLSAAVTILADFAVSIVFNVYTSYYYAETLFMAGGALIFCAIPTSIFKRLKESLYSFRERQLVRQTINRNRSMLSNRLYEISTVFLEMGNVFNSLKKDVMSEEKIKQKLCTELIKNACLDCENAEKCGQKNFPPKDVVEKLINIGLAKGKLSFIDLPKEISDHCVHANNLIFSLNKLLAEYRNYVMQSLNTDVGRKLIGSQAVGVSEVLKGLALETGSTLKYQSRLERKLSDALAKKGYFASELLVYGEGKDTSISLILTNKQIAVTEFINLVGECIGMPVSIAEKMAINEDKTYILLRHTPEYDAVFGLARAVKDGSPKSGDTHSVTRLKGDKFLVALSDGMGSGNYAESVSDSALSLIESFYKAGMDSTLILSTVNKVLAINTEDSFTALDVAVIDLKTAEADFIKFGAPYGFILGDKGIRIVEGNSLPLGILDDIRPAVSRTALGENDMLIFMSDGITDAFGSSSDMIDFLKDQPAKNPQTLAQSILDRALFLSQGKKNDDMTALTVRIFPRSA